MVNLFINKLKFIIIYLLHINLFCLYSISKEKISFSKNFKYSEKFSNDFTFEVNLCNLIFLSHKDNLC